MGLVPSTPAVGPLTLLRCSDLSVKYVHWPQRAGSNVFYGIEALKNHC